MIDVAGNRQAQKYPLRIQAARAAWAVCRPLFALSPRPLWGWRRFLLRLFGATVGREVHIYPSARVFMPWNLAIGDESAVGERVYLYNLGPLTIGRQVTISHQAHLCGGTHDYRQAGFPLVKTPNAIGDSAWICADAFVGPGVTVGARAIVGARCVAMQDVAQDAIVSGNPAQVIGQRPEIFA
ncbi:colanic acid biosynthesis acetyltransferase WcaF [Alteraurantiacibacter aestuarii]|uniref:putative colanic acid biosynthesis acetyltransferase n=1 Tax=Alteraurantiacibacter aestuarii TaxID=650004 RepID=UPI0031D08599